jgi:hypothetical protein
MSHFVRTCSFVLTATMTTPCLAQQGPASKVDAAQLASFQIQSQGASQGGYMRACGTSFRCYTGIPLHCTPQTRPYQNVAEHRCICVHDGCPQ